jgi:hypothetical protein
MQDKDNERVGKGTAFLNWRKDKVRLAWRTMGALHCSRDQRGHDLGLLEGRHPVIVLFS